MGNFLPSGAIWPTEAPTARAAGSRGPKGQQEEDDGPSGIPSSTESARNVILDHVSLTTMLVWSPAELQQVRVDSKSVP